MDRQRAKTLLPIIQAFANGEAVELNTNTPADPNWIEDGDMQIVGGLQYRIKPKPREFWLNPNDSEIFDQVKAPFKGAIKVREVIDE